MEYSNEKERTADELAMIHAAMMEELGIGRKDTLPLEDKGYRGPIPQTIIKPLRALDPNDPATRWHNIKFDDVDPSLEELDNIADGQLYRLRRGGGQPNRSRGAGRGGHSSGIGRAGASSVEHLQHGSAVRGSRSNLTPKTFFNDARRGANKLARIDAAIERLRSLPGPEKPKPKSKNVAPIVTSRPPQADKSVAPVAYNLASPEDFLSRIGFAPAARVAPTNPESVASSAPGPSSRKNEPLGSIPAKQSPSTASQKEIHRLALTPAKIDLPPVVQPVKKDLLPVTQSVKETSNAAEKPIIGLSSSQWAAPVRPVPAAPGAPPAQVLAPAVKPPLNGGKTLAVAGRDILKERPVKFQKNSTPVQYGKVRLVKEERQSHLTFEIEVENVVVLRELLLENVTFEAKGTNLTFRASHNSPSYRITFALPYELECFENLWLMWSKNAHRSPQDQQYVAWVSGVKSSTENGTLQNTPLITAAMPRATSDTRPVEPSINPSLNTPLSAAEPFHRSNRISSELFQDLSTIDGGERLISFADEEVTPDEPEEELSSALQDLLEYCDEDLVEGAFSHLNSLPEGSFLDQIARVVGGLDSDATCDVDLLSSPRVLSAAQTLVGAFLGHSEIFQRLPEVFVAKFIKDKGKKVLEKAVAQRDAALIEAADTLQVIEPGRVVGPERHVEGNGTADATGLTTNVLPRTTYTVQELLRTRHRSSACGVGILRKEELFPWKLPKAKPRVNPANIVNMTKSGIPIVAGREEPPRRLSRATSEAKMVPADRPLSLSRASESISGPGVVCNDQPSPAVTQEHDRALWNLLLDTIVDKKAPLIRPRDDDESAEHEQSELHSSSGFPNDPAQSVNHEKHHSQSADLSKNDSDTTVQSEERQVVSIASTDEVQSRKPQIQHINRHLPTVSDCDRIVKALERLDLDGEKEDSCSEHASSSIVPAGSGKVEPESLVSIAPPPGRAQNTVESNGPVTLTPATSSSTVALPAIQPNVQPMKEHIDNGVALTDELQVDQTLSSQTSSKSFEPLPSLSDISNKDLKGAKGLSSSKWATAAPEPDPRMLPNHSRQAPNVYPPPRFSPSMHSVALSINPLPLSPQISFPNVPQFAPVFQTILIPDPSGSGAYLEVTGMVKADSLPTIAHAPVSQENVPFTSPVATPTSFLARPTMHDRHPSDASSSSDIYFKADAPSFKPSTRSAQTASRPALSPRREDIQADLQSRLNRSVAER